MDASDRGEVSEGVPVTVRAAGGLVALEGAAAVIAAIYFAVRQLLGHEESAVSGYGNAVYFGILGGAVLAAGIALFLGRRWGRAIAVIAQLLLLPVTWSLLTDSKQPVYGGLLGVVVVGALVLLFVPASTRWLAQGYGGAEPEEPSASS
ncbi:hypothetical protein [Nocardia sp. NPDC052566]|uniref:hypothetical protein n=1 Tax=Nocardia sp. NPDC052566 TaxID=3364330 RepID=UPI0037C751BE